MNFTCAHSPEFTENSSINLLVTFEGIGEIPFTASQDDSSTHGRELYARAIAGEFGPVAPYVAPCKPLDTVITEAESQIDAAASVARSRFVSSGVGQDGTYVVKAQQAQAWAAAGYPADAVPPYVTAEAAAVGGTPRARADLIIATAQQWSDVIGPKIEGARIGGKAAVRAAEDVSGVESALAIAVAALNNIRP